MSPWRTSSRNFSLNVGRRIEKRVIAFEDAELAHQTAINTAEAAWLQAQSAARQADAKYGADQEAALAQRDKLIAVATAAYRKALMGG